MRVAAIQDSKSIQSRLDVEVRPHFAIDEHRVAEILANPNDARDVAGWISERPIRVELTILNDRRYFVRSSGNANGIGLEARIKFVTKDVRRGEVFCSTVSGPALRWPFRGRVESRSRSPIPRMTWQSTSNPVHCILDMAPPRRV
jgi:hypothetical protein